MPPRWSRATLVRLLFWVLAAWRGVVALGAAGDELRRGASRCDPALLLAGESARIRRVLERRAPAGLPSGALAELWEVLVRSAGAGDSVVLLDDRPERVIAVQAILDPLLFPVRVLPSAVLDPRWREVAAEHGPHLFLVELGETRHPELGERLAVLARGPGFVVWRGR